jgi:hypothetical protein
MSTSAPSISQGIHDVLVPILRRAMNPANRRIRPANAEKIRPK